MDTPYPRVVLKEGREKAIFRGHPWVFSGAIGVVEGDPVPGEIVSLSSFGGNPLGLGFYNPRSDITVRVITHDYTRTIDATFWQNRVRTALHVRKRIVPSLTSAWRVLNAEGDGVPGLIVDKYGEFIVMSLETAGMEMRRDEIVAVLAAEMAPRGIYERSGGSARRREGFPERQGTVWGEAPPDTIPMEENGVLFLVDVKFGQKTGFYLDQRDNRVLLERLSKGARVLNCFAYTGGFSLYALRGGAEEVTSVEISPKAIEMIATHLELNRLPGSRHRTICADVFDFLRSDKSSYDVICLDPPSFARSRRDVAKALQGYRDINRQAIKRLRPRGLLMTFSCSGAIDEEAFTTTVAEAVREAGCVAQIVTTLSPAPDHPVQLVHPEGRYLKGLLIAPLEGV